MNKQYSGLCIGGPLDGQMVVKDRMQFAVHAWEMHSFLRSMVEENPEGTIKPEIAWYAHLPISNTVNLWLYDGITLNQAFQELARTYLIHHAEKKKNED